MCGTFPGVTVITSEIDEALGGDYQVGGEKLLVECGESQAGGWGGRCDGDG